MFTNLVFTFTRFYFCLHIISTLNLKIYCINRSSFVTYSTAINFHYSRMPDFISNEKLCSNDKQNCVLWINEYWNYKDDYIVKKHRISYNSSSNKTEQTLQTHPMFNQRTFMSGKWIFEYIARNLPFPSFATCVRWEDFFVCTLFLLPVAKTINRNEAHTEKYNNNISPSPL
jgi:hypothetical protein